MTCESYSSDLLGQPINTLSNGAYFLTAIILFFIYRKYRIRSDLYFSFLSALVGVASCLTHISEKPIYLYFDYVAQFIYFSYMVTLGIHTIIPTARVQRVSIFVILSLGTALFYFWQQSMGIPIVSLLSALYVTTKVIGFQSLKKKGVNIEYAFLYFTIGCFAVGVGFFLMDYKRVACLPDNHFFQFHAVWHFLVALSMIALARFYRQFLWAPVHESWR